MLPMVVSRRTCFRAVAGAGKLVADVVISVGEVTPVVEMEGTDPVVVTGCVQPAQRTSAVTRRPKNINVRIGDITVQVRRKRT